MVHNELLFTIHFKDAFGKGTLDGYDQLRFRSPDLQHFNFHRFPTDDGSHLIQFGFNCSLVGNYYLNVTYREQHIEGSPFFFEILPGPLSHTHSKILGYGSWIADLHQANVIYVQLLDHDDNELYTIPTPTSLAFEKQSKPSEEIQIDDRIHNLITIQIYNQRKQIVNETFYECKIEYIGKSTWGIKYQLQSNFPSEILFLGIYYHDESLPNPILVGESLLSVYLMDGKFPYPPSSYKMLGPYPAISHVLQSSPASISTHPDYFRSYQLDKNGWLHGFYTSLSISDIDYQAEFLGEFEVQEDGIYLFLCLGVEHYTIDYPLLKSGDVWNIHQLSKGFHSLQVSTLAKRDWNFDFHCRFQPFYPLKSYLSESFIPDFLLPSHQLSGDFHILLQNLHSHPIDDLQVQIIALNDSTISPTIQISDPHFILYPQEFSFLPIQLDFQINENFTFPKQSFFIILAIFSPSFKAKTQISFPVRVRDLYSQSFQFLYEDTDQTQQIAIAKAPLSIIDQPPSSGLPVILVSHGGGVSHFQLSELYSSFPNAWLLFPKGRSVIPYEIGTFFDSNSLSSIQGLQNMIEIHQLPSRFAIDPNSILSIGSHYYGGTAALLLANYYPDRMLGVSANSAWIKHSKPFLYDFLHPMISGLIEFSSIHQEISWTTSNFRGVPFFISSGQGDTHGYPWRMFYQKTLLEKHRVEFRLDPTLGVSYKKHATSAVAPSSYVIDFISKRIQKGKYIPKEFSVSSWNPSFYHGRGGVYISSLIIPTQLATIDVLIQGDLWILNTTNTRTFDLLGKKANTFSSLFILTSSSENMVLLNSYQII